MINKIKTSYLKALIAILVLLVFYVVVDFPMPVLKKITQITFLGICIGSMLLIMREPKEEPNKVLNLVFTGLLIVSLVFLLFI